MKKLKLSLFPAIALLLTIIFLFSISQASINGWAPIQKISSDSASMEPAIAIDSSGYSHIFWVTKVGNGDELVYSKLLDNKTIVSQKIIYKSSSLKNIAVAIDSKDDVHLVFDAGFIQYMKLNSSGNILVNVTRISDTNASKAELPDIAVDESGDTHIVWMDHRNRIFEVYYSKLDSNVTKMIDNERITFTNNTSWKPKIIADSKNFVILVWREGTKQIRYAKIDNLTIVINEAVANATINIHWFSIDIDGDDNLHIVWCDGRGGERYIVYKKIDSNGSTIVEDKIISKREWDEWQPDVSADVRGNAHIVWGSRWLFYSKIGRNGDILIQNERASSLENPQLPTLDVDGKGRPRAVFQSSYSGISKENPGIYYTFRSFRSDESGNGIPESIFFAVVVAIAIAVTLVIILHYKEKK